MLRGDFHLHSNLSDGRHSPAVVVQRAASAGIDVMALTDHDITDGCSEAITAAAALGMVVICGVELSVTMDGREFHLLGLGLDPAEPQLQETLAGVRRARERRGHDIVARLAESGAEISLDRVVEIAGEGSIGRPHIAHALVEGGFASDVDNAFSRWLSRGRPGYVAIRYLDVRDAIRLVHRAGGITSLAHASLYREGVRLAEMLVELGMDAIEVVHPDIPPSDARALRDLAVRHDLVITGGSDDHGFAEKNQLGRSFLTGDDLDRLLQRIGGEAIR